MVLAKQQGCGASVDEGFVCILEKYAQHGTAIHQLRARARQVGLGDLHHAEGVDVVDGRADAQLAPFGAEAGRLGASIMCHETAPAKMLDEPSGETWTRPTSITRW